MRTLSIIVILLAFVIQAAASGEYVSCEKSNATHSLHVELTIPDQPHVHGLTRHFRNRTLDDKLPAFLPMFLPRAHSRQTSWRVSLVPQQLESSGTNMLYSALWRITDFDTRSAATNEVYLYMPLGTNFVAAVKGVRLRGVWKEVVLNKASAIDAIPPNDQR